MRNLKLIEIKCKAKKIFKLFVTRFTKQCPCFKLNRPNIFFEFRFIGNLMKVPGIIWLVNSRVSYSQTGFVNN